MDVLLTHGYFLAEDEAEKETMRPYPPLGLLYISSYLKQQDLSVGVFDSTFSSREALLEYAREARPSVIGIYVNLMTRRAVVHLLPELKKTGAWIVLGGPEPVSHAEALLNRGADVIVAGEGERTMDELVRHLIQHGRHGLHDISGVAFIDDDGRVARTPARDKIKNLDEMPFPDRDSIDMGAYLSAWRSAHGQGSVSLITARGCPFKCDWCSHSVFGHSHRRRSVENVADEVAHIRERYDPELLWYADDVFTINKRWFFAYAAELKRRGLNTPFETISREDRLDEKIVATLSEMECYRLWVGAESGSQKILDAMGRQTNATRMREMITLLQRHGIEAGTFIMLGYDGELLEDLQATVDHLKQALPDRLLTTIAYPITGTGFHKKVQSRLQTLRVFDEGSDRDATFGGRHSRRYYQYAQEWMVNEVEAHRLRSQARSNVVGLARHIALARRGQLGMLATRHEVD